MSKFIDMFNMLSKLLLRFIKKVQDLRLFLDFDRVLLVQEQYSLLHLHAKLLFIWHNLQKMLITNAVM